MKCIAIAFLIAFTACQNCGVVQKLLDNYQPGSPVPPSVSATLRQVKSNPQTWNKLKSDIRQAQSTGSLPLPNGCTVNINPGKLNALLRQFG